MDGGQCEALTELGAEAAVQRTGGGKKWESRRLEEAPDEWWRRSARGSERAHFWLLEGGREVAERDVAGQLKERAIMAVEMPTCREENKEKEGRRGLL
jgi:hypothetical protein